MCPKLVLSSGDVLKNVVVLTHCNTDSLACSGYGAALGMVRSLYGLGRLRMAYCTETRPYNQVGLKNKLLISIEHFGAILKGRPH